MHITLDLGPPEGIGVSGWIQIIGAAISLLAVLIAAWAALSARKDAAAGRRHQTRLLINDQLERYHSAYAALVLAGNDKRSVRDYCLLSKAARMDLDLVVARQIMAIDLMFEASDERGPTWLTFLDHVEGPIWNERGLHLYATQPEVVAYILNLRKRLLEEHGPPGDVLASAELPPSPPSKKGPPSEESGPR